jgi:hypothetical protein
VAHFRIGNSVCAENSNSAAADLLFDTFTFMSPNGSKAAMQTASPNVCFGGKDRTCRVV